MKILTAGKEQVRRDLLESFAYFQLVNLVHLLNNLDRLAGGAFTRPDGTGCLFYLLSELFEPHRRLDRRERLREFFTGGHTQEHAEMPEYDAPGSLVALLDRRLETASPIGRYHDETHLDVDLLREVLVAEIERRKVASPEAARPDQALKPQHALAT